MELLTRSVGAGFNTVVCEFPDDKDKFEGVRFCLPDEEIIVGRQDFASYIRLACKAFLTQYPSESARLDLILRQFV